MTPGIVAGGMLAVENIGLVVASVLDMKCPDLPLRRHQLFASISF